MEVGFQAGKASQESDVDNNGKRSDRIVLAIHCTEREMVGAQEPMFIQVVIRT